jgi:hypothetical protein
VVLSGVLSDEYCWSPENKSTVGICELDVQRRRSNVVVVISGPEVGQHRIGKIS